MIFYLSLLKILLRKCMYHTIKISVSNIDEQYQEQCKKETWNLY